MKKKVKGIISLLLAMTTAISLVVVPKALEKTTSAVETEQYVPMITATPKEAEMVKLLQGDILEFSSNYAKTSSKKYLPEGYGPNNVHRPDEFAPKAATLTWECQEDANYYTLKLSQKADMSDALSFVTTENTLDVEDLFMGTQYYYQVIAHCEGKTIKSRIFDFKTAYLPRTVHIEGVSNTRDMGGYYTVDGKHRVRQGMVYRGGKLETMTQAGKNKILNILQIKTDLDMRGEVAVSPLGNGVNFINVSGPYYVGSSGIDSFNNSDKAYWKGTFREALLKEIKAFANPDNYPIYIHCSLGRDRTGTLAFLINALLGVGEADLYRDYELSFFSTMGCLDGQSPTLMVGSTFEGLYKYIKNYKALSSTYSYADKTEKFLLDIGITQEEIDSIRSILLEEVGA